MRLAFLGTPGFAVPTLRAVVEAGHEVAAVYSQPPAPRGRGQRLTPSPVETVARELGLSVRTPVSLRAPEELATFAALEADVGLVIAYGQLLSQAVLDAPRHGCINLHGSLLPRWRGAAPIQRAIMAGDTETGVQAMRMTAGLDEGPVLLTRRLPLTADTTAGALGEVMAKAAAGLAVDTLARLGEGSLTEQLQPDEGVTYARKITPAETRLDWTRPAVELDRLVRGLSPRPGAWCELPTPQGTTRLRILLARPEAGEGEPGRLLDDALLVATGQGALRLLQVQREGRAVQPAADLLKGLPLKAGQRLG